MPDLPTTPAVFDIKRLAALLLLSPRTVLAYAQAGLPPGAFRIWKHWRFTASRINEWIETGGGQDLEAEIGAGWDRELAQSQARALANRPRSPKDKPTMVELGVARALANRPKPPKDKPPLAALPSRPSSGRPSPARLAEINHDVAPCSPIGPNFGDLSDNMLT
jgi:hypothetical protein